MKLIAELVQIHGRKLHKGMNIGRWGSLTRNYYRISLPNLLINKQIFSKGHYIKSSALWIVVSEGPQVQSRMQCALFLKAGFAIYLRKKNVYTLKISCNNMSLYISARRVTEVGEFTVETI